MNAPVKPIHLVRQRARQSGPEPVGAQTLADVREALGRNVDLSRRDLLIEHLHVLNDRFGQLRTDHLAGLAQLMRLSVAEVHEVASFYHHFEIVRPAADGRYAAAPALTVRVCDGIACELAGARELLAKLPQILGAEVRVIAAPCIGRCEQAPAAVVHQCPVPNATPASVKAVVDSGTRRHEPEPYLDFEAAKARGAYHVLRQCVAGERDVESVIKTMEASGLRGLGGAGFPAGRKWRIVRSEPGPRLMAVNIDEGEPGTFKDRHYLERNPHQFLEGLLIAAWAVGIDRVFVYLRDEYHGCRAILERELAALKAQPPMRDVPVIELRRGAGAYICGEESAMIESIEGKRGMPRLRPPYVAQVGLFGRPTLEHNFETLYWVPEILAKGADWFAGYGRHDRKGLRSFSVSGRVRDPGVKLAPAGITLRELIEEHCGGMLEGHSLYGYLPGGASGGILPASLADVPLDFDTLQPHGCFIGSAAVVVLSDRDRATDVARNLMAFFEHESCGQCTPCRAGTAKVRELIASDRWDRALLADLSQVMRDASICGLGQAAPNPVDCVVRYFPQELG
ncbi:NADH-ubiquinone oxidoreductase-F iron-sulfur binding region domain-containing protein [Caldimonas sp. KR1-144]|uniref:NADH-ubiquinone oxidoreductase-F iron-sulfur binding region domain-containing protein n=1 Tax=Caldimonas sp. KR1-144 TaxID=3400911 RepID=UPI003C0481C1